jgi:hypothetical protein
MLKYPIDFRRHRKRLNIPFLYLLKYRLSSAIVGAILNDRIIKHNLSGVSTNPCGANN